MWYVHMFVWYMQCVWYVICLRVCDVCGMFVVQVWHDICSVCLCFVCLWCMVCHVWFMWCMWYERCGGWSACCVWWVVCMLCALCFVWFAVCTVHEILVCVLCMWHGECVCVRCVYCVLCVCAVWFVTWVTSDLFLKFCLEDEYFLVPEMRARQLNSIDQKERLTLSLRAQHFRRPPPSGERL